MFTHLVDLSRSIQSNIFLKEDKGILVAAIGDFGSAKLEDTDNFVISMSTVNTSLAWTPPEYIRGSTTNYSSPTAAGDVWSFGCTILEVCGIFNGILNA